MCGEYLEYYVGEKDSIGGYVLPKTAGETVVINSGKYELKREITEEVVASGDCEVDGCNFEAMLQFTEEGSFIFEVTLIIGDMVAKEQTSVKVR